MGFHTGSAGGGDVNGGGSVGDDHHGSGVFHHHDRNRDRGAGGDRGEQQHRSDRHLSGIQPVHATDRGGDPHRSGAYPSGFADHHHHDGRSGTDDVRAIA